MTESKEFGDETLTIAEHARMLRIEVDAIVADIVKRTESGEIDSWESLIDDLKSTCDDHEWAICKWRSRIVALASNYERDALEDLHGSGASGADPLWSKLLASACIKHACLQHPGFPDSDTFDR